MNIPAKDYETNTLSKERRDSPMSDLMDDSGDNPLKALVDAAAMLDATKSKPTELKQGSMEMEKVEVHESKISETLSRLDIIVTGTKEDLFNDGVKKTSFAEHLMRVINDEANHDVLAWMPDGKSFTIVNHKKFIFDRMPKLFKIRNMSSFVRKLCRWGFQRVHEKETRNSDIFKHPFFLRDDPAMVRKIKSVGRVLSAEKAANAPPSPPKAATIILHEQRQPSFEGSGSPRQHTSLAEGETRMPPSPPLRQRRNLTPTPAVQMNFQNTRNPNRNAYPTNSMNHQHQHSNHPIIHSQQQHQHQNQQRMFHNHLQAHPQHPHHHHQHQQRPSSLNSMYSQLVSAAMETLHQDDSRSYNTTPRHQQPHQQHHGQGPTQMTMAQKATMYMNNSLRRMPVQLQQMPYKMGESVRPRAGTSPMFLR